MYYKYLKINLKDIISRLDLKIKLKKEILIFRLTVLDKDESSKLYKIKSLKYDIDIETVDYDRALVLLKETLVNNFKRYVLEYKPVRYTLFKRKFNQNYSSLISEFEIKNYLHRKYRLYQYFNLYLILVLSILILFFIFILGVSLRYFI